jgi:hypothetical protein
MAGVSRPYLTDSQLISDNYSIVRPLISSLNAFSGEFEFAKEIQTYYLLQRLRRNLVFGAKSYQLK